MPESADTETVPSADMCAGLVAPKRQKRKTVPEAWAADAAAWFAHVAACPDCSQFYDAETPPRTQGLTDGVSHPDAEATGGMGQS